jgi:hypothetical protein
MIPRFFRGLHLVDASAGQKQRGDNLGTFCENKEELAKKEDVF